MFSPPGRAVASPEEALRRARVIWAALLLGPIGFAVVIGVMFSQNETGPGLVELSRVLTRIAFGLLVLVVPLAYAARRRMFGGGVEDQPTSPENYVRGTVVFLAMCEFVSMFALVTAFLRGRFFPPAMVALVSMIVAAINYPDGRAMRAGAPDGPIEPR